MKLAKRALVLLLTLAMLVGCIPAFSVAAEEAVIEGVSTPTVVITSYEQIYVKDGLVLLSTVYGNEGDGNIDLSTGVWNNRVGDDNIAIVGYAREEGGYNGWWFGANGRGVGYNYSDYTNYKNNIRTWGMILPSSLLEESDMAVEYVFDYIGIDTINSTDTEADGWGLYDGAHAAFTFNGLFMTQFHASIGKTAAGMESRFHYGNVPFEKAPTSDKYTGGPNTGAVAGFINSWMLAKDDSSRIEARDGASTLTINRDWEYAGENKVTTAYTNKEGTTTKLKDPTNYVPTGAYAYAGYTISMNGSFKAFLNNHRFFTNTSQRGQSGYEGADYIDTHYYTAADINAEGQAQAVKYTAFDAFFGFPAEVYAVRVYDRTISDAEAAQNHFADTVAWFGNAAIDLATYSALSSMGKASVHEELATVAFTETTAADVNAVIAKWAAKEIATTAYDKMYVQDGLVLLVSAFGDDDSLNLANGIWYNKVENGVTNAKVVGAWTALNAGHGGIGYTVEHPVNGRNNYIDLSGAVSTLGDFTVEYVGEYALGCATDVNCYDGNVAASNKFGHWGDWAFFYQSVAAYRTVYNNTNLHTGWYNGLGWNGNTTYLNTGAAVTVSNAIVNSVENASYRTSYVNGAVNGFDNANLIGKGDGKAHTPITKNTEEFSVIWIGRGVSSEIYAARVYDRALSALEAKYNAAVDTAAYYGLDVSALAAYDAKTLMTTSFVNLATYGDNVGDTTEMQAVVATAATEAAAIASANVYNELYVQDGLNLLLLAYNDAVAFANVANGTWINLAGAENGKIVDSSADISWTANDAANGGGITYKFASISQHQNNLGKLGLTLPADTIGDDDFTVETVFIPHYAGDGSAIIPHSNNDPASMWGAYHGGHSNFTMGNIHLAFFQPSIYFNGSLKDANNPGKGIWEYTGSSANFRTMVCNRMGHESYNDGNGGFCTYGSAYLLGTYGVVTDASHNVTVSDKTSAVDGTVIDKLVKDNMVKTATSFVVTRDVNDDKSFGFTVKAEKASYSAAYGAEYYAANADCLIPFDMFYSFAATVYAIRAYDRVLSEAEIAQNKVVDVLAKTGADVSELLAMSENEREIIFNACAPAMSYTMSKAEAQTVLDDAIDNLFIPDTSVDAYSALYVQNGLQALYTAFDGGEKTVDLTNGVWYATGSDQFIYLNGAWKTMKGQKMADHTINFGDSNVATITPTGTYTALNGGIGYLMDKGAWNANGANTYINLGTLPGDEYTIEASQLFLGLSSEVADSDGAHIRYVDPANGSKWGVYMTTYSAFEFGWIRGTAFVCASATTTAGGGQLIMRTSYHNGYWGTDNGKYWLQGCDYFFRDAQDATTPVTMAYTHTVGYFDRTSTSVTAKADGTDPVQDVTFSETGVKGVQFTTYENGSRVVTANTVTNTIQGNYRRGLVTYTDAESAIQTGYVPYLSAAEAYHSAAGENAYIMRGMPGAINAIRIYDRALSAEEAKLNSLIDIAAYAGADVSALASYSEEQRCTIACKASALTYASTAAEVEAAIQAGIAALEDLTATYVTGAIGYQKGNDGTSLRIWATANLDSVWNADALGIKITVTGDAEKVLSGETDRVFLTVRSGDEVVCPEAEDTFYFAAVVEGIPEDQSFTFTITPYAVVEGVKVYGESKTLEWPAVE